MQSTLSWDMIPAARTRGNRDDSERSDPSLLPGAHMGFTWSLAVQVSQWELPSRPGVLAMSFPSHGP